VNLPAGTNTINRVTQDGNGGLWLYVDRDDATSQFEHYNAGT